MIPVVLATYRVQLHAHATFADVAAASEYLRDLGVSHVYCSPIARAAAGSTHGYDVVDPASIDEERGGPEGFDAMRAALAAHGLRIVLDIVPNHMAMAGRDNAAWWDVLARGPESPSARWFDIDWGAQEQVLMPVLGEPLGRLVEAGAVEIAEADGEHVVRVPGAELPLRAGSVERRGPYDATSLDTLLARQHYRLAWWRAAAEQVRHRRFFDITSLVGVRVEDDEVFDVTHELTRRLVASGGVDELRVDHVDGLRRPQQYLERLASRVAAPRVVVEKILQPGERLPDSWPVAGTSGYDFLTRVNHLFVDERNEAELSRVWGAWGGAAEFDEVAHIARRQITDEVLIAEVDRLAALLEPICAGLRRHRDHTPRQRRDALATVLASMPVYRTYAHPGTPASAADSSVMACAVASAARRRPDVDGELLTLIGEMAVAGGEFGERFQQVSSAVMAKGVEDTAFYRFHRLVSLNEVGGEPGRIGDPVADFHAHSHHVATRWPETMLTLATHDTKRSADVRARINALSEAPATFERAAREWSAACDEQMDIPFADPAMRMLVFQTLVGAWPIDEARLGEFCRKAAREAKQRTSWTRPDEAYETALAALVAVSARPGPARDALIRFLHDERIVERGALTSLAQTALLLTAPGVPDIYQGSETLDLSLVDPDNRRPVDFAALHASRRAAQSWDAAEAARHLTDGGAKQWLIARLLAERAARPPDTADAYIALDVSGRAARHAVAFCFARRCVVVPRLTAGWPWDGWHDTEARLPSGRWTDVLTGASHPGGGVRVGALLGEFPVAVLREEAR